MYPYLRLFKVIVKSQFKSKINFGSDSYDIINLVVLPNDIDPFLELNNGRYVTLLDLGRFAYGARIGMKSFLDTNKWSLTIAGTYNEYRYRLKVFQKFQIKSKILGYDDKWFYFFQKAERNGKTHMASVVKFAFTCKDGLVFPKDVIPKMDLVYNPKHLEKWVKELSKHEIFKK
tara:strand:+ start:5758 stop:6279 length:522 start_codon:yes stop_codon:yes gene_type:complete